MNDFLTSLDVVNQSFKKCMRGYDPVEVDEFLDHVAGSLQAYVQKIKDQEQELVQKREKLGQFESIRESIQEALIMAQRTAEERIQGARMQADSIVAEARSKVDRMVRDAEDEMEALKIDMGRLRSSRQQYVDEFRALLQRFDALLDESIEEETSPLQEDPLSQSTSVHVESHETAEFPQFKAGIEDALNAIGVDPRLLLDPSKMGTVTYHSDSGHEVGREE